MIEILKDRSTPTCVVARWSGVNITAEEIDGPGSAVDAAVAAAGPDGRASAVFVFDEMTFADDWKALGRDIHFVDHEYEELARVAYVGDVKWIDLKIRALGWMTKPKEKTFSADEMDAGVAWARGE